MRSPSFIRTKAGLYRVRGQVSEEEILQAGAAILLEGLSHGEAFTRNQDAEQFLQLALAHELNEHFAVLFLDSQNRLLRFERLFSGSINQTEVHPRVIAQRALQLNAGAVILAHNHPSGHPEPSKADQMVTQQIRQALNLFDIQLLDHIIVTRNRCTSLAERGLL